MLFRTGHFSSLLSRLQSVLIASKRVWCKYGSKPHILPRPLFLDQVLLLGTKQDVGEGHVRKLKSTKQTRTEIDIMGDVQMKIRMSRALRELLEKTANEHGVSANAEVVTRLRKSIEDDRAVANVLETRVGIGIAKLLAIVVSEIGKIAGFQSNYSIRGSLDWFNNPYAFEMATRAVMVTLDAMRPEGEIEKPQFAIDLSKSRAIEIEESMINEILHAIVDGDIRYANIADRLEDTRTDLGDLYPRLSDRISKLPKSKMTKIAKAK